MEWGHGTYRGTEPWISRSRPPKGKRATESCPPPTISVEDACSEYGITQTDVALADPPISFTRREDGTPVVDRSYVASFARTVKRKKADEEKKAIIARFGTAYFDKIMTEREAAEKNEAAKKIPFDAAKERRETINRFSVEIAHVLTNHCFYGISEEPVEGATIKRVHARDAWFTSIEDVATFKSPKSRFYLCRLSDVIGAKRSYTQKHNLEECLRESPEKMKAVARYRLERIAAACEECPDDDIVKEVFQRVRRETDSTLAAAEGVFGLTPSSATDGTASFPESNNEEATTMDSESIQQCIESSLEVVEEMLRFEPPPPPSAATGSTAAASSPVRGGSEEPTTTDPEVAGQSVESTLEVLDEMFGLPLLPPPPTPPPTFPGGDINDNEETTVAPATKKQRTCSAQSSIDRVGENQSPEVFVEGMFDPTNFLINNEEPTTDLEDVAVRSV